MVHLNKKNNGYGGDGWLTFIIISLSKIRSYLRVKKGGFDRIS